MNRSLLAVGVLSLSLLPAGLRAQGRAAARQRPPRPLTSVELLLKLYHASPAAAASAIKLRGTGFDVTPALEQLLVEAGADKQLLALAALGRVEEAPAPPPAAPLWIEPAAQARKLLQRPEPVRPAGVAPGSSGRVTIEVIVGRDGRVKTARATMGEEPWVKPALEATEQSVYRPTVLDGEPVEVITEITIQFQPAPPADAPAPTGLE